MEERSYDEVIAPTCPSCRSEVPPDANVCPNCGYRLREAPRTAAPSPERATPAPAAPRKGTTKAVIGGILLVISGLIGIIEGIWIATAASVLADMLEGLVGDVATGFEGIFLACAAILLIIGLIALIGGVFAIRRRRWGIAVVGGIFALFTLGIFFFEGSILGLIGLILVAISKDEFS